MTTHKQVALALATENGMEREMADDVDLQLHYEQLAYIVQPLLERVWQEGADSAFFDPETRGQVDHPENPYKVGQDES